MARDRGPPVLRQSAADLSAEALPAEALPAEARGWGWLGAGLWPALVVGLLAALVAWLWYGGGDGRGEEGGEAAAPLRGGGEGPPQARGEATAATGTGRGCCGEHCWGRRCSVCLGLPKPASEDWGLLLLSLTMLLKPFLF